MKRIEKSVWKFQNRYASSNNKTVAHLRTLHAVLFLSVDFKVWPRFSWFLREKYKRKRRKAWHGEALILKKDVMQHCAWSLKCMKYRKTLKKILGLNYSVVFRTHRTCMVRYTLIPFLSILFNFINNYQNSSFINTLTVKVIDAIKM